MSDPAREVRPAASSFTFRLRFVLPERMRIDSTATELDLSRTSDPYRISLRQVGTAGPLSHAAVLCALGEGYRTAADAEFAGRRFEDALAISFARIGLGAIHASLSRNGVRVAATRNGAPSQSAQ